MIEKQGDFVTGVYNGCAMALPLWFVILFLIVSGVAWGWAGFGAALGLVAVLVIIINGLAHQQQPGQFSRSAIDRAEGRR